jgi:hypothetical protein
VDEGLRPVWVAPAIEQTLLRLCRLRWKYRCRIADLKKRLSTLTEMVVPGIDGVMPVRYSKSARLFMRRYLAPARARPGAGIHRRARRTRRYIPVSRSGFHPFGRQTGYINGLREAMTAVRFTASTLW